MRVFLVALLDRVVWLKIIGGRAGYGEGTVIVGIGFTLDSREILGTGS